jgi:hypothetical protein
VPFSVGVALESSIESVRADLQLAISHSASHLITDLLTGTPPRASIYQQSKPATKPASKPAKTTKPAVGKGGKAAPKHKFIIDYSRPAADSIFDTAGFEKFLHDHIKVDGKEGNLGDSIKIKKSVYYSFSS